MVDVRYVDFGYKNTISVKDLRQIKDEFFALPEMVRLKNAHKPVTMSKSINEINSKNLVEKYF